MLIFFFYFLFSKEREPRKRIHFPIYIYVNVCVCIYIYPTHRALPPGVRGRAQRRDRGLPIIAKKWPGSERRLQGGQGGTEAVGGQGGSGFLLGGGGVLGGEEALGMLNAWQSRSTRVPSTLNPQPSTLNLEP